jgi:hypothetical protein
MSEGKGKNISREERLAAKLRENLRRRKAQARVQASADGESPENGVPKPSGQS